MRFRKIAVALLACMAVAAVSANAAQAQWTIGGIVADQETAGTALGVGSHETVEINKHEGSELVLHSTVLGAPITLTAANVHCAVGAECTIDGENFGTNHSTGKLEFTGVTVDPSTCSVPGGKLTTTALKDEVIDDTKVEGSKVVFDKFSPASGTTFVEVTLEGAECPFNEVTAPVTGTATGEAVKTNAAGTGFESIPTGTLRSTQTLLFGTAQQATGGGELKLGKAEAQLTGAVDNVLSGPNQGHAFGADK
jgi:hypothetical protein